MKLETELVFCNVVSVLIVVLDLEMIASKKFVFDF